jgi:hypothetical protein
VPRSLLWAYRFLLRLYPPVFRKRFAREMLEIAEVAESSEWPLIFGDTGFAIVRCWLEGDRAATAIVEPNVYLGLGESPVRRLRFVQGFVLSIAILIGLCYFSHWTAYRECPGKTTESAQR